MSENTTETAAAALPDGGPFPDGAAAATPGGAQGATPAATPAESPVPTDLEIAQRAAIRPIEEVAAAAGINPEALDFYGRFKAKIDPARLAGRGSQPQGKVVLDFSDVPDSGRRGKVHGDGGSGGLPGPRRAPGDDRAA
ncbi:hypothetical protein QFZ61_001527 [Arthrobacter sp. B3I4]|nr:hypothetical protein [Arthrobacter sp. B3I4]